MSDEYDDEDRRWLHILVIASVGTMIFLIFLGEPYLGLHWVWFFPIMSFFVHFCIALPTLFINRLLIASYTQEDRETMNTLLMRRVQFWWSRIMFVSVTGVTYLAAFVLSDYLF